MKDYQTANLSKLPAGLDLGYFRSQVQTDKRRRDGFYPTLVEGSRVLTYIVGV